MTFRQIDPNRLSQYDQTFFDIASSRGSGSSTNGFSFFRYGSPLHGGATQNLGYGPQTPALGRPRPGAADVFYAPDASNFTASTINDYRMSRGQASEFFITTDPSFLNEPAAAPPQEQQQGQLPAPVPIPEVVRNQPQKGPATVRRRRSRGQTFLSEQLGGDILLGA